MDFCLLDDSTVGFSHWENEAVAEFELKFGPFRRCYTEVEVSRVVLPAEAQTLILKSPAN